MRVNVPNLAFSILSLILLHILLSQVKPFPYLRTSDPVYVISRRVAPWSPHGVIFSPRSEWLVHAMTSQYL